MNYVIIFFSEIIQNIWWIILTFVLQLDNQFIVIALSSVGVILKFVILKTFKNSLQFNGFCSTTILLLINTIIYTETNLLMYQHGNPFSNHTCTLFIVSNQQIIKELVSDKVSYHIFTYCYPCYVMLRLFSLVFINFDYYILESIVIVIVFTIMIIVSEKNNNEKNLRLSLQMIDDNDSKGFQSKRLQESSFFIQNNKSIKPGSANLFYIPNDNSIFNSSNQIKKQQSDQSEIRQNVSSQSLKRRETEAGLGYVFHNLFNQFSEGVMIIDSNQQVLFMNNRIEKYFSTVKEEEAIKILKQCLTNLQISSRKQLDQPPICTKKIQVNQAFVEEIVKQSESNNQELDVLDLLLNPSKYLSAYTKRFEKQKQEEQFQISTQENQILFEAIIGKRNIQIRITPTRYFSQRNTNNNNFEVGGTQPILLVLIKNITALIQLEEAGKEFRLHYSLLKQFSYELRAPINVNQQILNLILDIVTESQVKELVDIAQISNQQQLYQINDILDYAAIKDNQFKYNFSRFLFNEIITEIENVFQKQMKLKNIKFQIEYQQALLDHYINSDKLRILQILVNLLNNSCKHTRPREQITLSFISLDDNFIEVKITDSGAAMDQLKIAALKNSDSKTNLDKNKQKNSIYELWLGLYVSRNIVEGLIETGDNFFDIQSNPQTGNKISFWIQDMDQTNPKEQQVNRNKQMTGKFVNITRSGSIDKIIIKNYDDPVIKISPVVHDESYVQNRERIKSQDSSQQYLGDDCNDVIIVPESNHFKFKSTSSLAQMLEKKTFSFKLSTLQLHECSQSCRRVLIVDDMAFNCYALTSLLYNHQILCDQANDGYQAIEKVKEKAQTSCPYYEVIFMNIEMPGQNNLDAIKEINELGLKKYIIICSAYDSIDNEFSLSIGATEFLKNPVNQNELLKILKKYQLIYVNTIRPKDNSAETYSYYKLPYCQPNNTDEVIETLGQSLSGDQQMTSLYQFNSTDKIVDKLICEQTYNTKEIQQFINAIDQEFIIEFYLGDSIMQDVVGKFQKGEYYLKNRITFNLYVSDENRLLFSNISVNINDYVKFNKELEEITIPFYFTVNYYTHADPETIDQTHHSEVKWYLLMMKGIIIIILVLIVSDKLRKVLRKDYSNIPDEENEIQESGWRAIKVESLMPPSNRIVFSALIGTGMHFIVVTIILLLFGCLEMFETHKGSIKSTGIIVYSFAGTINGYFTGRFYKFFGGKSWLLNLFITAAMFPISAISIIFIIHIFGWLWGTTTTFPFSAIFSISFILAVVYLPLTIVGGVSGRLRTIDELFEKRLKKKISTSNFIYLQQGLIYGILPFISMIMELYYVLEGTWGDQHFHQYTLLIFSFIQLLIIVGCLAIIQTYTQLKQGNYNWQWTQFINGGMCILYMFCFIFFYYYFVNMHGLFQFFYYFGESILACFALQMMLGTVSYWCSLKFVIYIYSQNKI